MAMAWLIDEQPSGAPTEVMKRLFEDGAIVPSLWKLEVANALRTAVRRNRCDEAYVEDALKRLSDMPLTIDDQTDIQAWGRTRRLSQDEGLTVYDAAYLELALRLSLPLASCDGDLLNAARRRGVEVLPA